MRTKSPPVDPLIRERMRILRNARGMSQKQLSKHAGLRPSAISHIETERRLLKPDELAAIAGVFRRDVADFTDPSRWVGQGNFHYVFSEKST